VCLPVSQSNLKLNAGYGYHKLHMLINTNPINKNVFKLPLNRKPNWLVVNEHENGNLGSIKGKQFID
jgi:hypothetical protein